MKLCKYWIICTEKHRLEQHYKTTYEPCYHDGKYCDHKITIQSIIADLKD